MMREPLFFHPVYRERVWGGRTLEEAFGRTLPGKLPIGESWEIVDRPEAQSVVAAGALKDWPLRRVIETHAGDLLGPDWPGTGVFRCW